VLGRKSIRVCIAGAITAVVIAVAGCGGGSSSSTGASGPTGAAGGGTVSASAYVTSVCTAVQGLKSTVAKEEASFKQAASGSNDATAVKGHVTDFLSQLTGALQQTSTQIQNAGTPDVAKGDQIASQLNSRLDQVNTALQGVEKDAANLPTDSPQAFATAVQSLDANLQKQLSQVSSIEPTGGSSDLQQAASQSSACKGLQG
jgi:uncharacterized phage infection (PIP) family protein YhgE